MAQTTTAQWHNRKCYMAQPPLHDDPTVTVPLHKLHALLCLDQLLAVLQMLLFTVKSFGKAYS